MKKKVSRKFHSNKANKRTKNPRNDFEDHETNWDLDFQTYEYLILAVNILNNSTPKNSRIDPFTGRVSYNTKLEIEPFKNNSYKINLIKNNKIVNFIFIAWKLRIAILKSPEISPGIVIYTRLKNSKKWQMEEIVPVFATRSLVFNKIIMDHFIEFYTEEAYQNIVNELINQGVVIIPF